jgi:hypothetical protein
MSYLTFIQCKESHKYTSTPQWDNKISSPKKPSKNKVMQRQSAQH